MTDGFRGFPQSIQAYAVIVFEIVNYRGWKKVMSR